MSDRGGGVSNTVSAGWGSDLRIAAVALMAPLLCGSLVLLGLIWLGGFGIVIGIAAAIGWLVWWFRKNEKFFPRDVENGPFYITIVLTVVVLIVILASS